MMSMIDHNFKKGIPLMSSNPGAGQDEGDLAVAPAKPKLKRPSLYRVVLLNDDYTPMEFVVEVLEHFFSLTREKATQVMLAVHTQGKASVASTQETLLRQKLSWSIRPQETMGIHCCARLNPRKMKTKEKGTC